MCDLQAHYSITPPPPPTPKSLGWFWTPLSTFKAHSPENRGFWVNHWFMMHCIGQDSNPDLLILVSITSLSSALNWILGQISPKLGIWCRERTFFNRPTKQFQPEIVHFLKCGPKQLDPQLSFTTRNSLSEYKTAGRRKTILLVL